MRKINDSQYFDTKTYIGFIAKKITGGQAWKTAVSVFEKIRKYTFVSSVIRVTAFTVALLEKSAVLLLLAVAVLLSLPVIIAAALLYLSVCKISQLKWNKKIENWLTAGEMITVFITNTKAFSTHSNSLYIRHAKTLSNSPKNRVLVVCSDPFPCAKWYAENILAVKENYFFVLKRKFIEKSKSKSTFIVL